MRKVNLVGKNILITGAAGFIGAALARRVLDGTDSHVIGFDNLDDYYDVELKLSRLKELEKDPDFTFIKGDLADRQLVDDVFKKYHPDVVVNLAAQAGVRYSIENPETYISSNIVGFFNILENCRHHDVEHLVYASSSSVYGDNPNYPYAIGDDTDKPVSLYAATKKSNEVLAYSYARLYGIPLTGLRFFTVYGPAGRPDLAYFSFTQKLLRGETIEIFNYGKCERDFTYIDDIIEGVYRVMQGAPENPPFKLYNIGNGRKVDLMEFVRTLCEELIRAEILPADYDFDGHMKLVPMQPGDVPVTFADTSELEKDFGFKPDTSLRTGLRNFAAWYGEYYGGGSNDQ